MNNRQNRKIRYRQSKIDRIEKKCARILSELAIIRRHLSYRADDIDDTIERMHRTARRMRDEAASEARLLHRMFRSKLMER